MNYNGTIYRSPIEANTFLVPVTEGCSHNSCSFCNMFAGVGDLYVGVESALAKARLINRTRPVIVGEINLSVFPHVCDRGQAPVTLLRRHGIVVAKEQG